jgi:fatty acid desaturase
MMNGKGEAMDYQTSSVSTKASADPYQELRRSLLPIETVRALSQLRPLRVTLDAARSWACIVAAWTIVAIWPYWLTVLLAMPIIGSCYYAIFIIGHDGMHRRLFQRGWLNDLFNDFFCLGPIGAITRINNKNHLAHHHSLATSADPDRHKHGCFNKATLVRLLGYLTGITSIVLTAKHVFWDRTNRGQQEVGAPLDPKGSHYRLRDLAILLLWQIILIGGLSFTFGWWAYPLLWLLPVFLFSFLADNLRSFAEHSQPEPDARADDHRLITYLSNPIERWFIAPMNMNYHATHHLWPSIPYYNLPKADRLIRQAPAAARIEWRGSYLRYLWTYATRLPLEECMESSRPSVGFQSPAL